MSSRVKKSVHIDERKRTPKNLRSATKNTYVSRGNIFSGKTRATNTTSLLHHQT